MQYKFPYQICKTSSTLPRPSIHSSFHTQYPVIFSTIGPTSEVSCTKKTPILKTNEECVTFSSDHLPVCITSMPYTNTFPNQQCVVILCRAAFCGSTLKTDSCVTVYFVNCTISLNFVNLPILQQLCIYEHKHIIVINICIPKCVFYF